MLFLGDTGLPLELAPLAEKFNLDVGLFAQNSRQDFYMGMLWIIGAGAIALFAPGTLRLLAFKPIATDQSLLEARWAERDASKPPRLVGRAGFTAATACVTGLLLFVAVRTINSAPPSEFLYFQF
jgi:hypothetical protein